MKKVLLSLIAVTMMNVASWAQVTNAQASQDFKTVSTNGYGFEFSGDSVANCFGSNGARYYAQVPSNMWSMVTGSGMLTITVPTQTSYDGSAQQAHFFTGNCVSTTVDLSATSQQKMRIKLTASGACQVIPIVYSGASSTYTDPAYNSITFYAAGTKDTTFTFPVSSAGLTAGSGSVAAVSGVGLVVRGKTGWGDISFVGTVNVDLIEVGDAINATPPAIPGGGTTAVTAEINNSLVSVYPNPAKDQITVDFSSLNTSDASVKIMNANGFVVYEAKATSSVESINTSSLNKGMYMVQVSAGDKVSNKKIVIE
jgi:hypothetical protein